MGVPKFFRYISERYPCLSELARENSIPEFDNLYLDMNGIIHKCSHPDDGNIQFNITEDQMFTDIFNYIDKLFFLIKPQKLFFLAVDGVAPRAKMNQQRSRRFRSAKEAEMLEAQAARRGEIRDSEPFDSNCITPGTEFMYRLQEGLRHFIKSKISTDPQWQKCRVILSGQSCPGEGEHKIMDYIRYLKAQSNYDPHTRHCLYGLDADLIILGLCTHELHFVVLREEVKFGKQTKRASAEETRFFLLHLGLMREYLELDFDELRRQDDTFNIAKLIDDWVLMGFLVGNDFIPHLPCLHISSNALPLLYKTYIKVYPTLGGNINVNGKLNLDRLEKYFAALTEVEFELFQESHADLKYFNAKLSKNGIEEAFDIDVNEIASAANADEDFAALIASSQQFMEDDDVEDGDESLHIQDEFESYKRNYYMTKLQQQNMSSDDKRDQAICYITALQWILDYYYRGVQSWDWYYPHHYAPFISDLKNFSTHEFHFTLGKPFRPFEQLLAVLPAASKKLLPSAYQELMTSPDSPIISFYPNDFETDLNGKQHEWEAVVLIPIIDEQLLLSSMKTFENRLSSDEVKRNEHGPMWQYDHCVESQGSKQGLYGLKTLNHVFCTKKAVWSNEIKISAEQTVCVDHPNAVRTVYFPGFPTMKYLKFSFQLKHARVKVFDYPSRNENMVLLPESRPELDNLFKVAEKYLNQTVFIGWPHLVRAQVVAISNESKQVDSDGIKDVEPKMHQLHAKAAQEHMMTRMAIEFPDFNVMLHVRTHIGCTYVCGSQGKVSMQHAWSQAVTTYPAQGVVAEIAVHESMRQQYKKVEQLFPEGSTVFFVGNPYFGSEGTVLNPLLVYECGRLKVNITVLPEPDLKQARRVQAELERDYCNSYQACAELGVQARCLGRLTGTVLVVAGGQRPMQPQDNVGKTNIGLQLKYPKQQEERAGYARRIYNQWYYSTKAMDLISAYCQRFPMVVEYLSRAPERNEFCFEVDLFPTDVGGGRVEEVAAWVKQQAHMKAERITCGSKAVVVEAVEEILESIEQLKTLPVKTVKLQVKPHLLLKPDISLPDMYKSKHTVRLFDRVVVVRSTYMVPLGAKGTVVGVYPISDPNPVRLECVKATENFLEVLFDKSIPNGNDIHGIAPERVYKVPEYAVLVVYAQDSNEQQKESHDSNLAFQGAALINGTEQHSSNNRYAGKPSKIAVAPSKANGNQHQAAVDTANQRAQDEVSVAPRDGEDFWLPAAATKIKLATNLTTSEVSAPTNHHSQPIIIQKQLQDCQAGTMLLKNMLGLTGKAPTDAVVSTPPQLAEQFKQIPQPPLSWRSDAQNANHAQNSNKNKNKVIKTQYFQQQQQPPLTISQPPIMHHNIPSANAMRYPHLPVQPLALLTSASPQAPPTYTHTVKNFFNAGSMNQQGAFIPLQVMRPLKSQPHGAHSDSMGTTRKNFNNLVLNAPENSNANGGNATMTGAPKTASSRSNTTGAPNTNRRTRRPRPSKIAARFDNAH